MGNGGPATAGSAVWLCGRPRQYDSFAGVLRRFIWLRSGAVLIDRLNLQRRRLLPGARLAVTCAERTARHRGSDG